MNRSPYAAELLLQRDPEALTRERFDAVVIGGGINGAGIARDLALRGLRTALLDKGDFGSGTSSASTKLIHGGVRYLENLDFGLVFESCRERAILQKIAPHLVRPLPFFIPVYGDDPRSLTTVRLGMILYDLLAFFRNTRHHSILAATAAIEREPALRPADLRGVALYWDCRMDDARLCLENVLAARSAGAEAVNYFEVVGLLRQGGRLTGVRGRDGETGQELEVAARVVVNAAGPWLDRVCALDGEAPERLRPTRGTHILVPRINRGDEALYLTAGRDKRLFFVIPWGELSLIGTTDVDFAGDPDDVQPTGEDIDYLLGEAGRHLRDVSLTRKDIVAAFAGLRPLVAAPEQSAGRVSREHAIYESPSGLISLGGGKYTTYRVVAAEVADLVTTRLQRGQGCSRTGQLPLPGGATGDMDAFVGKKLVQWQGRIDLPPPELRRWLFRYGSRTDLLLNLLEERPELVQPVCPGSTLRQVEVIFAVRRELARTPEDVLRRRTTLSLERGRGLAEVAAVAALLEQELGPGRCREGWVQGYREKYTMNLEE